MDQLQKQLSTQQDKLQKVGTQVAGREQRTVNVFGSETTFREEQLRCTALEYELDHHMSYNSFVQRELFQQMYGLQNVQNNETLFSSIRDKNHQLLPTSSLGSIWSQK